ncbi:MAG: M20/M25/M40 family metallo-hydrolase [Candidatus Bathyarchaeia archaeon]|jgi:acetylornithine deacetylase/succinyl-diaminopimelate desuccinylase-like protein
MPTQTPQETQTETTNLLSQLIQHDTTNPPGNETTAATWLKQNLTNEGFQCELIESAPNRGSLITRLKGTGQKPRLLLLSHLDVVAANPKEWSVPPFSGAVKDGFVWGRGTLDMKGMTAIEAMTLKLLKRNHIPLKGDVILAATADEEAGGVMGADFLTRNFPEKVFAEYVLNEGGGSSMPLKNKNLFTINVAEKGLLWFRVRAGGFPGHGSVPSAADNAVMRMNHVVDCLGNYRAEVRFVPAVEQFLVEIGREDADLQPFISRLLAAPEQSDAILAELDKVSPDIAEEIRPRIRMTITPTIIHGGIKENIIPSECEAVFDCRVLPGQSTAEALEFVKKRLADAGLTKLSFEVIQSQEPSESPANTPLYQTITNVLKDAEPNCEVVPLLMPGGTDSRFFRRLGSVCYGFHPLRSETIYGEKATRREHGIDERISVDNLVFGVQVLYETVKRFMT